MWVFRGLQDSKPSDSRGCTVTEYALMLCMACLVIAALSSLGQSLSSNMQYASAVVASGGGSDGTIFDPGNQPQD